jgi:hypothetical protein
VTPFVMRPWESQQSGSETIGKSEPICVRCSQTSMNHDNKIATAPRDSILESTEPAAELLVPEKPLQHPEKGSLRSMWELLMQLRVLLPYLSSLVPLLDRGLSKMAPDLSEVRKGMTEMQSGNRDLGVQIRNQTLRLEQIEVQMARLGEAAEQSQRQNRDLAASIHTLTQWVRVLAILTSVLLVLVIVVAAFELSRLGH